jgi:hypothetical protein
MSTDDWMNRNLARHQFSFPRIAATVAAVLIVLASIADCGAQKKPSTVVKDLVRMVERGEIDQAARYNSQGFVSRYGIDSVKESLRQTALWIKRDGGVKSIDVLKEDTVGEIAEVTIKVTRGGGDSSIIYYKLIWENGDWKIDGVASDPTSPPPSATPSVNL